MAAILTRASINILRNKAPAMMVVSTRGKKFVLDLPSQASLEHATGLARQELEAIARGEPDPFDTKTEKINVNATKENPNLVPSFYDKRIIGCLCHEDLCHLKFMWVHKDDPKRCECGHWFALVPARDPFKDIEPDV